MPDIDAGRELSVCEDEFRRAADEGAFEIAKLKAIKFIELTQGFSGLPSPMIFNLLAEALGGTQQTEHVLDLLGQHYDDLSKEMRSAAGLPESMPPTTSSTELPCVDDDDLQHTVKANALAAEARSNDPSLALPDALSERMLKQALGMHIQILNLI